MEISEAVRVIKGQEVLPDGSTLEEHGITDGSTVNIVIEPDEELNLMMKLGPKEFTQKMKSSVRVSELKQQLIDGGNVGVKPNAFTLLIATDDNADIAADIPLLDESLPLHLCGVSDNTSIRIICGNVLVSLITQYG